MIPGNPTNMKDALKKIQSGNYSLSHLDFAARHVANEKDASDILRTVYAEKLALQREQAMVEAIAEVMRRAKDNRDKFFPAIGELAKDVAKGE